MENIILHDVTGHKRHLPQKRCVYCLAELSPGKGTESSLTVHTEIALKTLCIFEIIQVLTIPKLPMLLVKTDFAPSEILHTCSALGRGQWEFSETASHTYTLLPSMGRLDN